jgi:hypothetical protein
LKQLQNEFRSGLRELDAVKAELVGSMMPRATATGGIGRNLNYYFGTMVWGVDWQHTRSTTTTMTSMGVGSAPGGAAAATSIPSLLPSSPTSSIMGAEYLAAAAAAAQYYLGTMVWGVDRQHTRSTTTTTTSMGVGSAPGAAAAATSIPSLLPSSTTSSIMGAEYLAATAAAQQAEQLHGNGNNSTLSLTTFTSLAPRSQSVAAMAEEEWEKRGIGFRSIAESGAGGSRNSSSTAVESRMDGSFGGGGGSGGAVILSNYLRQSLIYDQYERTIREQDEALRSRVEKVRNE